MKIKQVMSVMSLLTLFIFYGCTINENHYGPKMETINIIAYQRDWSYTAIRSGNKGHYMYQEFSFPEINNDVLNDGAVLVYLIDDAKRDNILPLVLPYYNNDLSGELTENVRYECENGILTIIIESSDFSSAPRDRDMKFKVCILKQ
jgi:hypothetical protein